MSLIEQYFFYVLFTPLTLQLVQSWRDFFTPRLRQGYGGLRNFINKLHFIKDHGKKLFFYRDEIKIATNLKRSIVNASNCCMGHNDHIAGILDGF